jgi:hypothetical protein
MSTENTSYIPDRVGAGALEHRLLQYASTALLLAQVKTTRTLIPHNATLLTTAHAMRRSIPISGSRTTKELSKIPVRPYVCPLSYTSRTKTEQHHSYSGLVAQSYMVRLAQTN